MLQRLARDGLFTVAAFFVTALFNYAFSVLMGRWLPPDAFGRLSVALTIYMLGATVLVSGFPWMTARELARRGGLLDDDGRRLAKTASAANTLLAVLLSALLLGTFALGLLRLEAVYRPLLWIVAAGWLVMGVQAVWRNTLRGLLRLDAFVVAQVLEAASGLLIGAVGVWLGFGAPGALSGQSLSIVVVLLFVGWLLRREALLRVSGWTDWRLLWQGLAFFIGTAGITYLMNLDVLGVKWFVGGESDVQAGLFQVAATLARPPAYVALALANAALPHLARAQNPAAARRLLLALLAALSLTLLPFHAALAFYAEPIVAFLYPPIYAPSGEMLHALAWVTLPLDVLFLGVAALQAAGREPVAAASLLVGLGAEWLLMQFWVPRMGALGAGYSLALAGMVSTLVVLTVMQRVYRLRPNLRWLSVLLGAGGAVWLLWVFRPLGLTGLLLSGVVFAGIGWRLLVRVLAVT